jgi:methionyl-tRNA synthetase
MSKSLGTTVDPIEAAERLGPDPLRLYLVKEIPYGSDGDFSWERLDERYNADLANNLGNLVSRIASMADRYRGGRLVPAGETGRLAPVASDAIASYRTSMEGYALHEAAAAVFRLIGAANEFIAETEPWALARRTDQSDRLSQVLFDVAEAVRIAGVLLLPIMPASAAEILRRVGEVRAPASLRLDADARWRTEGERVVVKADPLWPRIEARQEPPPSSVRSTSVSELSIQSPGSDMTETPQPPAQPDAVNSSTPAGGDAPPAAAPAAPAPPQSSAVDARLSIDEFMKIDLRVAKVVTAERVPKSKKLVKLTVDVGTEQRTLVAGIAEAYEPDALVGRSVVIVANLKPATLMGIESNGMVLAGSPEGGKPELIGFVNPPPPGTRVR